MPRSNSSVPRHKRHRKIVKSAKGYYGVRKSNFRAAKDAVEKGLLYSYRDRRNKKRTMRALWIIRINAAVRQHGLSYSKFISLLKEKNINIVIRNPIMMIKVLKVVTQTDSNNEVNIKDQIILLVILVILKIKVELRTNNQVRQVINSLILMRKI